MRSISVFEVIRFVLALHFGAALVHAFDDRNWTSNTSSDKANWFNPNNWNGGVPTSSDHAIIPASLSGSREMPVIYSSDGSQIAYAQKITVNASGSDIGTLDIYGSNSLLILGDGSARTSTVHGKFRIGQHGAGTNTTVKIRGDHTIQGAGGEIVLEKDALIDEYTNDGDDKLTLKRSGGSACEDYPDGLDCNVLLHGTGTIKVQLDNRAFVLGDYAIVLDDRAKTGTSEGWWIAENNGSLTITCDVSGAGHWFLADLGANGSTLEVGTNGCVSAAGPVLFKEGQFRLSGGDFCTTGDMLWKSVCGDGGCTFKTQPKFFVDNGRTATFGLGGAGTCGSCP